MADINSNIKVNIDTSDALAQLKLLQQQISAFQQAMRNAGAQNASAAVAMQQNLITSINATGKFRANIQTIKTSAESFTESLEKNKFSIGEYFRYAGGASKTFGKLFKSEFATINQVAKERVKELQTQYIKLGRDANGAMKAIAVKPLALDMDNLATKTQIAAQRQQLFNQLMKQGSTSLLNFGKNTQWAGRQLMVGFTIPLTMMGSAAAKAYMQIEAASVKFKRVYGDINTTTDETNKMVKSVQSLANEFTKYGVAVADTMDMAAKAAAMGKTGKDLLTQINQSAKLAILGGVDQNQALDATISLTNAFGVSAEDLSRKIDFLNAVENQTVLSIEDMATAIPKAAPVVQQLGGSVEDLTFFLTAMREGGINASEGANALKSGLASLINPSAKASQFLQGFGINVKGIVEADKGNLKKTVIDFAKALDTLDPLNRARAIEQMFGKFQFSRISTLFKNVIDEGSQASQVAKLSNQTAEELAVLSEREMKKISDSPMFKFQKSIQDMQAKLAPVGEAFLKAVTPVIEFVSKILDGFNSLGEGAKNFISMLVLAVAGIGPVLLMTFGLIANGVANIMKLFTNMKGFINKTTKPSDILGEQTQYMTTEQLKGAAVAASLDQAHAKLRQTFTSEKAALDELTRSYRQAVEAQQQYSGVPGVPVGNPNAMPKRYANGVSMVPGPKGAGDIIPALLSPGEAVIPAKHAQKYAPVIAGMVAGNLPGFEHGTTGVGMRQSIIGPLNQKQTEGMLRTGKSLKEISDEVYAGPYGTVPPEHYVRQIEPTKGHSFPAFQVGGIYEKADGTQVFVKPQMDLTSALAEVRGTQIARDAHQLTTPMQKIVAMMDPTDPEGMRKFIALESPLNEQIAKISTSFTKQQYFKQLVASLLRGDKDLGIGNLGRDILADVGTAGVFQTASGKRKLGGRINSMEEQAIINLLGVKGGAKRFFAESTSDIASKMSPAEYDAAMKAEIQAVMPRLQATIASFGNLSPEEKAAYMDMQQRLQTGMGVDWSKYQVMHSTVPSKKYALGGMVPGYEDGVDNVKKKGKLKLPTGYSPSQREWFETGAVSMEDALFLSGLSNAEKFQKAHLSGQLDSLDPEIVAFVKSRYGEGTPDSAIQRSEILPNFTANVPAWVNQKMRNGTDIGIPPTLFTQAWNALKGKLYSAASIARPSISPTAENLNAIDQIESAIGQEAINHLSPSLKPTSESPAVYDTSVDTATRSVLERFASRGGAFTNVASSFQHLANIPGTARSVLPEVNGQKLNATDAVIRALTEIDPATGQTYAVFSESGAEIIARGSRGNQGRGSTERGATFKEAGRWVEPPTQELKNAKAKWIAEARPLFTNPTALRAKLQELAALGLAFRTTSQSSGSMGIPAEPSYENAGALISQIIDRDVVNLGRFSEKNGFQFDSKLGFLKLAKGGIIPGYADGVFSVPGPKGAGDVVPAMLSPGEAVIPANRAAQHRGLIKGMIAGNLPGYAHGGIIPGYEGGTDNVKGTFAERIANALINAVKNASGKISSKKLTTTTVADSQNVDKEAEVIEKKTNNNILNRQQIEEQMAIEDEDYRKLLEKQEELKMKHVLTEEERKLSEENKKLMLEKELAWKTEKNVIEKEKSAGLFKRTQATGRLQSTLYGLSAAAGMASTMPGQIGQTAQAMLPAIGAATTAMSVIPGWAGAIVGAGAALVTVFMQINDHLGKLRDEAMKLGTAMGASRQSIDKFAEFAKTVTGSEVMDKRRTASAGQFFNVVEGKTTFGESYMKTDAGKDLVKSVSESIKTGGLSQAKSLITNQLTTAIASGALSPAQARSIAANLGAQLGDMSFGLEISGKITDLVGPKGEDLKKEPLQVRMKIVSESMDEFKKQIERTNMSAQKANAQGGWGVAAGVGGGIVAGGIAAVGAAGASSLIAGAVAGGAAASVTSSMGAAILGSQAFGPVVGIIAGLAIATTMVVQAQGEITKNAGYLQASLGSALSTQQQMVDSLEVDYQKRIDSALAAGDTAEATRLQNQYLSDQAELLIFNKQQTQDMYTLLNQQGTGWGWVLNAQSANLDAARESLKKAFEGTGQELQAKFAQENIDSMKATDVQKTMLMQAVAQKQLGANQTQVAKDVFGANQEGADQLQKLMENSPIELNRTLGLAGNMDKAVQKKYVISMSLKDPIETKQMNDAIEMAQKTTGIFFGDKKVATAVLNFAVRNQDKMLKFKANIDALKKSKEITTTVIGKVIGQDFKELFNNKIVKNFFDGYNKANRAVFITEFQQIMSMKGDPDMIASWKSWNKEHATNLNYQEWAATESDRTVTMAAIDNAKVPGAGGGGGGGPESSWLDQFVKTMRDAGEATQKLTTGFKDSAAALKKFANSKSDLVGLFTELKAAGASADIIEAALGGDEATTNKLIDTKTGQLVAGAEKILDGIDKALLDRKMVDWLMLSPIEKLQKRSEMYSANLEVIKIDEDEINKRYDDRIKALDEINTLNERNTAQQQSTLTLADALAKGDIAAAARAALDKRKQNTQFAIEDQKKNLELARQLELQKVTADVNGVILTRAELEEKIATLAERTTRAKAEELEKSIRIGDLAVEKYNDYKDNGGVANGGGKTDPGITNPVVNPPVVNPPVVNPPVVDTPVVKPGDLYRAATEKGLTEAKAEKEAPLNAAIAAAAKDYGLNASNIQLAVNNGDMQPVWEKITDKKKQAKFATTFKQLVALDKKVNPFEDTFYGDIQTSTKGKAATKAFIDSLPTNIQKAITAISYVNRYTKFRTDVADLKTKQDKYKEEKGKAGFGDKEWDEIAPGPKKTALMKFYNPFHTKQILMINLHKDVNTAIDDLLEYSRGDRNYWTAVNAFDWTQLNKYDTTGKEIRKWSQYASGGMVVPKGYSYGGGIYGTDTVPAMLTPGEFVIRKAAVDSIGLNKLNSLNSGTSSSDSVYNYSINVNVSSNADANDIARTVMTQIRQTESQRIRSNTY